MHELNMTPAYPIRKLNLLFNISKLYCLSLLISGYYFEIPSIGAIRINTQVRHSTFIDPTQSELSINWTFGATITL